MKEITIYFEPENKFSTDIKLTYSALCQELIDENEMIMKNRKIYKDRDESYFRDKFKNADRSGIVDRLLDKLNFDVERIAEHSKEEKFNMLKLLKILYRIEKEGSFSYENQILLETKVPIIDILSKPRLANIITDYSECTVYGNLIEYIIEKVKLSVYDASERDKTIYSIDSNWNILLENVLLFATSDRALDYPEIILNELKRIDNFLEEMILKRFYNFDPTSLDANEGIMKTFYNILMTHKVICDCTDEVILNYDIVLSQTPDSDYITEFKKYENVIVNYEILEELRVLISRCKISKINISKEAEIIYKMLNYGEPINATDLTHYKYAIDKFKILAKWFKEFKTPYTKHLNSEEVYLPYVVVFIQEIVHCKKNNEQVTNSFYGYKKNKYKSLMSGLKNDMKTDSVIIRAWEKRLQNRISVNFGLHELIKKARDIEIKMCKIKEIIYSYRNLDDLVYANEFLMRNISVSLIDNHIAIEKAQLFDDIIKSKLYGKAKKINKFYMKNKSRNITAFFKYLFFAEDYYMFKIASQIADQLNTHYSARKSRKAIFTTNFSIVVNKHLKYEGIIGYCVDIQNKDFAYLWAYPVTTDADIKKMEKLGLKRFTMSMKDEIQTFKGQLLKDFK